ncbi:hypothetical protein [Shinella sp.]|uniref:hypothetical protein n=1 Tax=Shinella sp. TaxID=1870904 RepID=UPI004034F903
MENEVKIPIDPSVARQLDMRRCMARLHGSELTVSGTNADEVREVSERLARFAQGGAAVGEHLQSAKGLFYLIISGVLVVCLAFILTGLGLVYLGASGETELAMFGLKISTANVGIVSIALGALALTILIQKAMHHIHAILALRKGPYDR